MRLLNVVSLEFAEFPIAKDRPKYVIASHRWNLSGFESTYQDVKDKRNTDGIGFQKVEAFAKYIKEHISSVEWLWIDTCCINKESTAELSEAINLMFDWYRDSEVCLAYLRDVDLERDHSQLRASEWFTRGWTLQELVAPRVVVFLTSRWETIGNKGGSCFSCVLTALGPSLERLIAGITNIPRKVLCRYAESASMSAEEKSSWMDFRNTAREEDKVYALCGILDVALGANYGEGYDRAHHRLQQALENRAKSTAQQIDRTRKILDWIAAPEIEPSQERLCSPSPAPEDSAWLLNSEEYQTWKNGSNRHLWIHGPPGCGKTCLCSATVKDIKSHCSAHRGTGQVVFFFTRPRSLQQAYEGFIRSLVRQLGLAVSTWPLLWRALNRSNQKRSGVDELQTLALKCTAAYETVFLHLDSLDECPSNDDVQHGVLDRLRGFIANADNVRLLATSQATPAVQKYMDYLGASQVAVPIYGEETMLRRYIEDQMASDWRLSQVKPETRQMIAETIEIAAAGSFRLAIYQMQELKKTRSTRAKALERALKFLPGGLDETYEQILLGIPAHDRGDAYKLIGWISLALYPLTLEQLAEIVIIVPEGGLNQAGVVDIEDRGGWGDALSLLTVLITCIDNEQDLVLLTQEPRHETASTAKKRDSGTKKALKKDTKVRLAHSSIKEYFQTGAHLAADALYPHLDRRLYGHDYIAQSCLVYLYHYSHSTRKAMEVDDLKTFPLLEYAAGSWFHHLERQTSHRGVQRALSLLTNDNDKRDWLRVYDPDKHYASKADFGWTPFARPLPKEIPSALYLASLLGLVSLIEPLFERGCNVNALGGYYGSALQAASYRGHTEVVDLLLERNANVNLQGGEYGNAIQAAVFRGHRTIVELLLRHGADLNAQGAQHSFALQAAIYDGDEEMVELLLHYGADLEGQSGEGGTALQVAAYRGNKHLVDLLLRHGANINAHGRKYGNALQAAAHNGHNHVALLLLQHGADVNAQDGEHGTALGTAAYMGQMSMVKVLLHHGALINAQSGVHGNALQAALSSSCCKPELIKYLIVEGADVNAAGGKYGSALQAAFVSLGPRRRGRLQEAQGDCLLGQEQVSPRTDSAQRTTEQADQLLEVVRMLLRSGVNVNAQGGKYGNALQAAAAYTRDPQYVELLVESGAVVNAEGGKYGNPLQAAVFLGDIGTVRLLLRKRADINARGGKFGSSIQAATASHIHPLEKVKLLLEKGADVNLRGGCYGCALDAARRMRRRDIFHLLRQHGAVSCRQRVAVSSVQPNFSNLLQGGGDERPAAEDCDSSGTELDAYWGDA